METKKIKSWNVEFIFEDRKNTVGIQAKALNLTLVGQEDEDVLTKMGMKELRLTRIMRFTKEAAQQGYIMNHEELSALLFTPLAILKKDIAYLVAQGHEVPVTTKLKNINRSGYDCLIQMDHGPLM